MYNPWQNDASMESVMKLIEERERNEVKSRGTQNSASNWGGIMSLKDLNAPKRHPGQDSPSSHWRGGHEMSGRPQRAESPRRRGGAELAHIARDLEPVAKWGVEIARSLTTQLRVNRRSSSSEDDRGSSRFQDSPTHERKRRRSRSASRSNCGRRSCSKSNSKDIKRNRSRSRERKRVRSNSREKKRYRSNSREKKRERKYSGDRQRNRSGSRDTKRRRSNSRDKRDRSNSTGRNRDRDSNKKRELSPNSNHALNTSKAIEVAPALTPALAAAAATNDILSKFVSMIKDVREQSQSHKTPDNDVLPEFDPVDKSNTIITWLTRVEDIAKLFGWDDKAILQHALPKLTGEARAWYLGRKDFIHAWVDWKKKLIEQYPCQDYAQMLKELLKRHTNKNETLEQYFCDKIVLVKRCGIKGRQAVECVLQGVLDKSVRLFAAAANFEEPDELLRYLRTAEALRSTATIAKPPLEAIPTPTDNSIPQCSVCNKRGHLTENCFKAKHAAKALNKSAVQCTVCFKYGHESFKCWKANQASKSQPQEHMMPPLEAIPFATDNSIPQCSVCNKRGHLTENCFKAKRAAKALNKSSVQCTVCFKYGHESFKCRKANQAPKSEPQENVMQMKIPKRQAQCFSCGSFGHKKNTCPTKAPETQTTETGTPEPKKCFGCGTSGHVQKKCPMILESTTNSETALGPFVGEVKNAFYDAGTSDQPPPPGEE